MEQIFRTVVVGGFLFWNGGEKKKCWYLVRRFFAGALLWSWAFGWNPAIESDTDLFLHLTGER